MTTEAVKAGYYESPNGHVYPKLQILTIEGLLHGTRPKYPFESFGTETFKKAKREPGIARERGLADQDTARLPF